MCFVRIRPLGLRTRFMIWSIVVLGAALAIGFAWVHQGLRFVLDARNEAFLDRKATDLLAGIVQYGPGGGAELEAEIRREVQANEPAGLIIVVRQPGRLLVVPNSEAARRLCERAVPTGPPVTIALDETGRRHRVLIVTPNGGNLTLKLGISLAETETTIAEFNRRVAGRAFVFVLLAVASGLFLSRQAFRPLAASIRAARRLDPVNLAERLPLTGAGDELDELAATINGLLDRLAAYHAQVIRFTADASHELRSPLAAMRAGVEVALQKPRDSDEYRNVLASLGEQCERLTTLINGLLLLAQADAGEVALRRESVDLADLARDVAEMYDPLAEERGIHLMAEIPGPVIVLGDSSRLRQLATNLIDNAIRFTAPSGSVFIRIEAGTHRATLRVTDTGVGVAAEHLPHIFDRFYQADAARTSAGGLGLSICRWIARAHGGTIEAASGRTGGAEFIVELPLAGATPGSPPSLDRV